ncbi:MAG: hypothetical protein QW247_06080 [Pyrobaculum sp.]
MNLKSKTLTYIKESLKSPRFRYLATLGAAAGLSLILYPALWNAALGGLLEKAVPPVVYNAVHELRHLWGVPCH